jgi:hypothetical protein
LQNHELSGGKKLRLSFTRSRMKKYLSAPNNKFNDTFSWVFIIYVYV